jgi:hypothetical protein
MVVVLGGHLLVIVIFFQMVRSSDQREVDNTSSPRMLILVEPQRAEPPAERAAPPSVNLMPIESLRLEKAITQQAHTLPKSEAPSQSEPSNPPAIDWHREGERAARITTEKATQSDSQQFDKRKAVPSHPETKPSQFDWNPEPKKAGFDGGLPYIRLGKRCVLGLGFFGCAIGDLPEANGHLFDEMRDPNQPESSVPEPP